MPYHDLLLQIEAPIAQITLNRTGRRNALSLNLMTELIHCLDSVAANPAVSVVVLGAAGPVFSSGHDLTEMLGRTVADYRATFDLYTRLMTKIQSIPQPV